MDDRPGMLVMDGMGTLPQDIRPGSINVMIQSDGALLEEVSASELSAPSR